MVIELGSKYCEASNFQTVEELVENNIIKIVVINHRITGDEVVFTDVLFRERNLALTKHASAEFLIAILLLSLLEEVIAAVDSLNIHESRVLEILTNIALTTTDIENLC